MGPVSGDRGSGEACWAAVTSGGPRRPQSPRARPSMPCPKLAAGESARLILWARCVQQPPWLQETAIGSPWSGQHGASVGGKDRGQQKGWTGGWKGGEMHVHGEAGEGWPTDRGTRGGRGRPRRPWALAPASAPLPACQLTRRPAALAGRGGGKRGRDGHRLARCHPTARRRGPPQCLRAPGRDPQACGGQPGPRRPDGPADKGARPAQHAWAGPGGTV